MSATARRMIPIVTICLMQSARLLAADDGNSPTELQEIVVTAQKRAEELDKVPISITVFDKAAMDERGIIDINGIAAATPGVDYQSLGTVNSISIRGVAPTSGYATTGTYIDDVPVQVRSSAIIGLEGNTEPRVFDLDRVEILRGPQGTLYGAGAMGGLLRFITPQPSLTEDSGYARTGAAITDRGDPSYEIGAAYGGPIVDNEIGFRVSAWHRQDGGFIDDVSAVPGGYVYPNANWQDSDVLRGAMTFAPTDSLTITPSIFYQYAYEHDISEFQPAQSAGSQDVFTSYFAVLNPRYSNVGKGIFVNPNLLQEPSNDRFYLPSVKAVYSPGPVQLSFISSYYNRANDAIQDFSTVTPGIFGVPWQLTPASADTDFIRTTQQVLTDEVRFQSATADSPLQWTVGILFIRSRQQIFNPERSPYLPTLIQKYFGTSIENYLGENLLPGDLSYIGLERDTDTQTAIYGQTSYQITKQLAAVVGLRVAREVDKYSIYQTGPYNGGTTSFAGEQSETVKDPKFGINYQWNDDNLLYVSAAKGDRIGGVNSPLSYIGQCKTALTELGFGNASTYDSDSLWSYEIGDKSKLLDKRVDIETSGFYINWTNVQNSIYIPACAESLILNIGKVVIKGADFSVNALVTNSLKLGVALSFTRAAPNAYAAPWMVDPTAEYTFNAVRGFKPYLRIDDEFHSKNPTAAYTVNPSSPLYDPGFVANPSTNELNVHLGASNVHWDVSLYALNALNSHPILYSEQNEQVSSPGNTYTFRPLTVGFTVISHW